METQKNFSLKDHNTFGIEASAAEYISIDSIEQLKEVLALNIGRELFYFNEKADEQNLKIMKFEISRSIKFLDSLEVYNKEDAYYNATKKLFSLYKEIANIEYTNLLQIIEDPELEAKDFKIKKKAIFDSIRSKSQIVYPEFLAAQSVFCKKYGIKQQ